VTLSERLKARGLVSEDFDLKSTLGIKDRTITLTESNLAYGLSAFSSEPQSISRGDLLLVGPDSKNNINPDYIDSLLNDYRIVYESPNYEYEIPNFSLRSSLKKIYKKFGEDIFSYRIDDENANRLPRYYIFEKIR
jgi:hypothetical protein